MKKILYKILVCAIALCMATTTVGCGLRGEDPNNASSKTETNLTIGVFDGGLGSDWIFALKKKFEEKYKDIQFEPGRKGVNIKPVASRSYTATSMEENMSDIKEDIIFAEGASAYHFAERGDFLDITDVVKSPLQYDFVTKKTDAKAESVTIESKLNNRQKEYFSAIDNKYFALPSTEKFFGIAYDIEYFEQNNLFFKKGGGFVSSANDARDCGPDGKFDSYDDGLPATYEDFFKLCDKIKQLNITPLLWGGTVQEYVSSLLTAFEADYVGAEQAELSYNFNGILKDSIASFNASGDPVYTNNVEITAQKGYEIYKSAGKYHALDFLQGIVDGGYYNTKNALSPAFSHQDAEGTFVSGKYRKKVKRAAMLIDGVWWQSEAKGIFNELAAEDEGASMQNRKFGLMPLPKVDREHLGDYTVLSLTGDIAFINKNIPDYKINLAKSFLQYCYTNDSCVEYTRQTNVCRPISYDMGEAYNGLSSWEKAVVDIHNNAKKAYQDSDSKIMRNYSVDLWYAPNIWLSTINGKTQTYPTMAMINDHITAEQYFKGLSTYWTPAVWNAKFKNV